MRQKDVLLLYSGGLGSVLSTCYLIREEYPVDKEIVDAITSVFKKEILPKMGQLMSSKEEKQKIKNLKFYEKKVEWL